MEATGQLPCTSFVGTRRIASGRLIEIVEATRAAAGPDDPVVIFGDESGEIVELDFRGTAGEIVARIRPATDEASRDPGRPKPGVVAREVTLLPRHWDWLDGQPGGASVALRKLVEEAARSRVGVDRARRARDAAYQFVSAMAGDRPGYEGAIRALFAGDVAGFRSSAQVWPADIRDHALRLARPAFPQG